jgi:hypothetical protein
MMRQSIFAVLVMSLVSFYTYGQDTIQLKRTPYKLTLAVDKKTVYEEDIKASPYILPNNVVQLYPGETVFIEVEEENGIINSMTAVKENVNPSKTLVLSFSQTATKKVHQSMMLKVFNPFKEELSYNANIYPLQHKQWIKTSIYPVAGGLSGFESWPDIIISISLDRWTFKS